MNKTLFIAHRGYSKFEKENTLISFTAAGTIKEFYGIETDIHITTDNHYITIHDENTKRISNNLIDINVENNSYKIIKEIILPDIDNSTNRTDLRIPEMIEYFKICKKYNKVAICEFKQEFSKEQIKDILNIIDSINMLENTIFISFHLNALINLRKLTKTQKAQYLLTKFNDDTIKILKENNLDLDIFYQSIDKSIIDLCHENNIKVNIWTVDDLEIAKKFVSWNVDYITSNWISKI